MEIKKLIRLAKEEHPKQPQLEACWYLIIRGLEVEWLAINNLHDLLDHLLQRNDYCIEEIGFEFIGDHLRISFLDEYLYCSPKEMTEEIKLTSGKAIQSPHFYS